MQSEWAFTDLKNSSCLNKCTLPRTSPTKTAYP